ncbi:INO80 complex subunit D-like [Macadamia integrifolia]|uniref:INO80 complex subunit D-like n=1 Tax=Macadamia integrifolia TaxID=60698 RepID=UPI001C4EFCC3|nr:INO80 complex subunit D-like [Macadamia integrifolia]
MGSANKHHSSSITRHNPASSAKSSKKDLISSLPFEQLGNPSTSSDTEDKNPNINPTQFVDSDMAANTALTIDGAEEDSILCDSKFLTREEVIRRRSRRVKQLARFYKDHYWALMEDLRVKYREYYWKYGKSPFKEEEAKENGGGGGVEGSGENNRSTLGIGENNNDVKNNRCAFTGCKAKAMALTNYCHPHILSDSKQKLYKPCTYVVKSSQTGPVLCGKPTLRSTVPVLCTIHFQKAQKHLTRALKKAGLNISSPSSLSPKLHPIIAESVRQIQAKRRAARRANGDNHVTKEENAS